MSTFLHMTRRERLRKLTALSEEFGGYDELRIRTDVNTEPRRRASAAFHAKREAMGLRKVTLWLDEEAREVLSDAAQDYGSKDAAAQAAIKALRPPKRP